MDKLLAWSILFLILLQLGIALPQPLSPGEELIKRLEEFKRAWEEREKYFKQLEAKVSLLEAQVANLSRALKEKVEEVNKLKEELARSEATIDEVELLTLFSWNDTSIARRVNVTTTYGHWYLIDLREVNGRTYLALIIDGKLLFDGEIRDKPLPSTYLRLFKLGRLTYALEVKHLLIWVSGTETKDRISIKVKVAAINRWLFQKLGKVWPPLRELFKKATLIFEKEF